MMAWLVALASLVVAVLAGYAGYLWWRVWRRQRQLASNQAELEALLAGERQQRERSIRILAQGALDDQLGLTEAAIRITALLDILGDGERGRRDYAALYKLADETLHIPRLEQWRALSRQQRRAYDGEREQSEAKYRDFARECAQRLRGYSL